MKTGLLVSCVVISALALSPSAGADPIWEFVINYDLSSPTTTFSMNGVMHSVIECAAGWQISSQSATSTPTPAERVTVYGSYLAGVVRFEEQHGLSMNRETYTCLSGTTLVPIITGGEGSPNWHPFFVNEWSLSPLDNTQPDQNRYVSPSCLMILFEGKLEVPFTGRLGYSATTSWGGPLTRVSGTWIANSLWSLSPGPAESASRAQASCGTYTGSVLTGSSVAQSVGGIGVSPVGEWRISPYYCNVGQGTCLAEAASWN